MAEKKGTTKIDTGTTAVGCAVIGCFVTGAIGLIGSVMSLMNGKVNGGLYLLAAAFAFGFLANAMFRN